MLPEAGVFEIAFLAAVALIVVGPKDLPVLLRKVGQFTAKMRGLAAEFRASFDEMARQSELDELRKEVDALRNGQFASNTTAQLNNHMGEINDHLNQNYWDSPAASGSGESFIDPHTGLMASGSVEGDETAALPPPGARTPPLPTRTPKKLTSASKAVGASAEPAPTSRVAAKKAAPKPAPTVMPAVQPVGKTSPRGAEADPSVVVSPPAKPARKRTSKPAGAEAAEV